MADLPDNTKPQSGPTVISDRSEIRKAINSAFAKFATVDGERVEARDLADGANKRAVGERESIITTLAAAASAGKWSGDDLAEEVADMLKARNAKGTSLATFASEIKHACARNTRGRVADLFRLAHEAWEAESDAIDAAPDFKAKQAVPKPMRRAFSRCYHAVVQYAFKAEDREFSTPADFVRFAMDTLRAREIDYKRVKGRLDNIRKELAEFAKDFPVSGIVDCVEFLASVEADELRQCVEPKPTAFDNEPERAPVSDATSLDEMFGDALGDMKAAAD